MGDVNRELERTFLARALPVGIERTVAVEIEDYYFASGSGQPRLRARRRGKHYELTKKQEIRNAGEHVEITIPLDPDEFHALRIGALGALHKDRFEVTLAERPAEVDVFKGDLQGLVLIEFEFPDRISFNEFIPPAAVCLADVTFEPFAAGGALVRRTFDDLRPELSKFGYRPPFGTTSQPDAV